MKRIFVSLLILIAFLLVWLYLNSTGGQELRGTTVGVEPNHDSGTHPSVLGVTSEMKSASSEAKERVVSYQEIQIVDDWFKASGLNMEQLENYKNQYTDNQLLTMGRNGDIVAYQALISRRIHNAWKVGNFDYSRLSAEKLVEDREAFDRAYQEMQEAAAVSEAYRKETQGYMDEAIAAGSVYEISARARSALKQPSPDDSLEQRAETLHSLREAFAYFELYSLRGADGVYTVDSAKQRELQKFRDAYDLDEPLTAQDYAWIKKRAQTLYQEYQRIRHEMGFGEFDNTMPPEVNEFLNGPFDR